MLLVARQRIAHESFSCWHELLLRAGWSFSTFPHNLDGFLLHFRFGLLAYPFSRRFFWGFSMVFPEPAYLYFSNRHGFNTVFLGRRRSLLRRYCRAFDSKDCKSRFDLHLQRSLSLLPVQGSMPRYIGGRRERNAFCKLSVRRLFHSVCGVSLCGRMGFKLQTVCSTVTMEGSG
jgi:hypothetical protein